MAAKKQDAGNTKKRKRLDTKTQESPSHSKTSNLAASKKHKPHSVAKDKKEQKPTLTGRERRLHAKVFILYCNNLKQRVSHL